LYFSFSTSFLSFTCPPSSFLSVPIVTSSLICLSALSLSLACLHLRLSCPPLSFICQSVCLCLLQNILFLVSPKILSLIFRSFYLCKLNSPPMSLC
jgi:hypothetical protein